MKKRDVVLDFTSLLDVTLIVIFFFVIFSHFDTESNRAKTEAKVAELEIAIEEAEDREVSAEALMTRLENETELIRDELAEAIEEAEQREADAELLITQLEQELEMVRNSDERQASDVEEIITYRKSGNVKIILFMQENGWMIRINCKEQMVAEIDSSADVGFELLYAIEKAEYEKEDTIFCDFVFDGSLPGTASAYRKIIKGLDRVEEEYKYLYYSETDLSIGEE